MKTTMGGPCWSELIVAVQALLRFEEQTIIEPHQLKAGG